MSNEKCNALGYCFLYFCATVLIYNNKDKIKNSYIVIINMVIMIIKKIIKGKDAHMTDIWKPF